MASLQVIAWRVLSEPVAVPGRGSGIEWVLSPLLPCLTAMAASHTFQVAHEDSEIISGSPVAWRRATAFVAVLVVGVAAVAAGEGPGAAGEVAVRNWILLLGLASWSTMLLPPPIAWLPSLAISIATWLIGTPAPGEELAPWVVLLRPSTSATAWVISALLLTSGGGAYLACERPVGALTARSVLARGPS